MTIRHESLPGGQLRQLLHAQALRQIASKDLRQIITQNNSYTRPLLQSVLPGRGRLFGCPSMDDVALVIAIRVGDQPADQNQPECHQSIPVRLRELGNMVVRSASAPTGDNAFVTPLEQFVSAKTLAESRAAVTDLIKIKALHEAARDPEFRRALNTIEDISL